jgi:hypothetical protein
MFEVFDEPDLNVTSEKRAVSTVPTQALTLLNNDFMLIQAGHLADRVWNLAGADQSKQVTEMYRITLAREPTASEMRSNIEFLGKQTAGSNARSALTDLAHVLLNLNEFVYVN